MKNKAFRNQLVLLILIVFSACTFLNPPKENGVYKIIVKPDNGFSLQEAIKLQENRLVKQGITRNNIEVKIIEGNLHFTIKNISKEKKETIKILFSHSYNLEFWETYENADIYVHLEAAEKILDSLLNQKTDSAVTDSQKESGSSLMRQISDKNKEDSIKFATEHALFSLLRAALVLEGANFVYRAGPVIGYANVKDTATINHYLKMEKIKTIFPKDALFLWGFKPFDKEGETFELIAVKATSENGAAVLSGDIIIEAKKFYNESENNQPSISIVMNEVAAETWKKLTSENIGKSVVISLDKKVITYPIVQSEISNGSSIISGNFTNDEANNLVSILLAGGLPFKFLMLSEEFFEVNK